MECPKCKGSNFLSNRKRRSPGCDGKKQFFLTFRILPKKSKRREEKHHEGHRPLVHGSLKRQTTLMGQIILIVEERKEEHKIIEIFSKKHWFFTWIWKELRWTNAQLTSCNTEEINTHPSYRHIYFTTESCLLRCLLVKIFLSSQRKAGKAETAEKKWRTRAEAAGPLRHIHIQSHPFC